MGGVRVDVLSVLDDPKARAEGDPSGALEAVASLPEQVRGAGRTVSDLDLDDLPSAERVSSVLFCGMGGSGIGGGAVGAAATSSGRVPTVAHRSYGLPAWCGPGCLVVASSYSGGTEETLDAFRAAVEMDLRGVAVTSGGALADEADRAGWVVARVASGLMPRYAVGWMTAVPALVLARPGLLSLPDGWAESAARLLDRRVAEWGPGSPRSENPAKALAHDLDGALPVVWGGDGVSAVAAARWVCDLNENAKTPAHAASLPEGDHNEIVAWAREGAEGRPAARRVLVWLRTSEEHPGVAARFAATSEEVRGSFDAVREVEGRGGDPLTRFLDLALLSGFVSVYLALLRGVDPVPIASIERLKAHLDRKAPG